MFNKKRTLFKLPFNKSIVIMINNIMINKKWDKLKNKIKNEITKKNIREALEDKLTVIIKKEF